MGNEGLKALLALLPRADGLGKIPIGQLCAFLRLCQREYVYLHDLDLFIAGYYTLKIGSCQLIERALSERVGTFEGSTVNLSSRKLQTRHLQQNRCRRRDLVPL